MANRGHKISLGKARKGDLLFLKTRNSKKSINPVGLIVSSKKWQIRFIYSTSSMLLLFLPSQKNTRKSFRKSD